MFAVCGCLCLCLWVCLFARASAFLNCTRVAVGAARCESRAGPSLAADHQSAASERRDGRARADSKLESGAIRSRPIGRDNGHADSSPLRLISIGASDVCLFVRLSDGLRRRSRRRRGHSPLSPRLRHRRPSRIELSAAD